MKVYSGDTFTGTIKAENESTLLLSGGKYNIVEIGEEKVENTVDFTILEGEFANITIGGKGKLILDFLAEGKALEDMNTGEIIDGRVGIAGNVKVVAHTHSCVWNTQTHE